LKERNKKGHPLSTGKERSEHACLLAGWLAGWIGTSYKFTMSFVSCSTRMVLKKGGAKKKYAKRAGK
jgi:hypothetical protein